MPETEMLAETLERIVHAHGRDAELWDALTSSGFSRVGVPEAAGGSGGAVADAYLVLDRLGWAAASVPVAETMVAGWLCAGAGLELPPGVATVAPTRPDDTATIVTSNGAAVVHGVAMRIPWASVAEHIVVVAPGDSGLDVAVVRTNATHIVEGHNLAGERRDHVELAGAAAITAGAVPGASADQLLRWCAMVRAVQLAGALRHACELARDHVVSRVQFGKPISAFQHVRMQLAEMAEEVAVASAAAHAAMVGTDGHPSLLAAASAWVRATQAADIVTSAAHQLHGAIGFTDEHPLHRVTTRAWSWRDELGGSTWWEEQLGAALVRAGADALWPTVAGA